MKKIFISFLLYLSFVSNGFSQMNSPLYTNDVGITQIKLSGYPAGEHLWDYTYKYVFCKGDTTTIFCTAYNFGTVNQTNVPIYCRVNNGPIQGPSYAYLLEPGIIVASWTTPNIIVPLTADSNITVKMWTALANDENHNNDTVVRVFPLVINPYQTPFGYGFSPYNFMHWPENNYQTCCRPSANVSFPWNIDNLFNINVSSYICGNGAPEPTNICTPPIYLSGDSTYILSFRYDCQDSLNILNGFSVRMQPFHSISSGDGGTQFGKTTNYTKVRIPIIPPYSRQWYFAFACQPITNSGQGNGYIHIDSLLLKASTDKDVCTKSLIMPAIIPIKQNIPYFINIKNLLFATASFNNVTRLIKNGSIFSNNNITMSPLPLGKDTTFFGTFQSTTQGNLLLRNRTMLTGDIDPTNDSLDNSYLSLIDTSYSWQTDDNQRLFDSYRMEGNKYYLSTQDTLNSLSVKWGRISTTINPVTLEVWDASTWGPPTVFRTTIKDSITLSPTDSVQWRTYMSVNPIILPAGVYFICIKSPSANVDIRVSNYPTNFTTRFSYASISVPPSGWGNSRLFFIKPNFKARVILPPLPGTPTLTQPANGASTLRTITFKWNTVQYATSCKLQIANDNGFATIIKDTTVVPDSARFVFIPGGTHYWRVAGINIAGQGPWSAVWSFTVYPLGINQNSSEIPKEFALYNNYPNPFNPKTTIKFDLPKLSFVTMKVYDISGKEIEVLANQNMEGGVYEFSWNATKYASGIYFYRITAGDYIATKKMILLK
jgi:hypothetical protein